MLQRHKKNSSKLFLIDSHKSTLSSNSPSRFDSLRPENKFDYFRREKRVESNTVESLRPLSVLLCLNEKFKVISMTHDHNFLLTSFK